MSTKMLLHGDDKDDDDADEYDNDDNACVHTATAKTQPFSQWFYIVRSGAAAARWADAAAACLLRLMQPLHAVYTDGAHAGSCGSGSDTDGSMACDALQASGPWPPCRGVLGYICRTATAMWMERRHTRFSPPLFSTGSRPASVASATGK